jgi:hypothetical protein
VLYAWGKGEAIAKGKGGNRDVGETRIEKRDLSHFERWCFGLTIGDVTFA